MAEEKELSPEILAQQEYCTKLAKELLKELDNGNYPENLIDRHSQEKLKLYDMKTTAGIEF